MNRKLVLALALVVIVVPLTVVRSQHVDEATGQKTLAATMKVYVFPKAGQEAEQQSKDEMECYNWAVNNTGSDPFELVKRAQDEKKQAAQDQEQARQAGAGEGARSAVRGAAVGALIGEIASDDPGEGAAYGAAVGLMRGRRRGRAAQQQAGQQAERQAQDAAQATAQQLEDFKKAFSVCLEAKDYLVKY